MPSSEKPKRSSSATRGIAHIRSGSARPRPTAAESSVRTGSSSSKRSRKTARRHSTSTVSQTAKEPQPPKNASMRELTRPTSRLLGSQVAANLSKAPLDAESQASLCTLKSSVHQNTSRASSGAESPSCAELLPGFVTIDSWDAVQANTYVILGHGPFQRRALACGMLSVTVALFHYLAYRLIGRQVDHWCITPEYFSFLSAAAWKNLSVPIETDGSYSRCTMYDPPVPVGEEENRTTVLCHWWDYDIANKADSIVSRFDLVCDRRYLYDLSSLAPIIGSALVAPLLGLASDRTGRKPVMLMCALVQLLATVACSVSQTYAFFVSTRVLLFVAADVTFLNTFILIHEVTGNAHRTTFTILDTAVPAMIVPPLMHALSLLEPRWALAQGLPVITGVMLAVWCYLQEEFALDATFIGVTVSDVTTGIPWEVAHVIAFAAYVASICVSIRRYGVRVTLSSLLVILSAFCILETLTIIAGEDTLTRFVHAVRNVGISLAHLAGGVGNVVAIAVILYTEPHSGHVFYALSAFMVLLSVAAIQWLPEVYVERPPRVGSLSSMSVQERKAALVASLSSGTRSHRHRESKTRYLVPY
ncbi:hypothetical protein MTO96_025523 [Rhipicephalus appendiculatus]